MVIVPISLNLLQSARFCPSAPPGPRSFALHVAVSIGVVDSDPDELVGRIHDHPSRFVFVDTGIEYGEMMVWPICSVR